MWSDTGMIQPNVDQVYSLQDVQTEEASDDGV